MHSIPHATIPILVSLLLLGAGAVLGEARAQPAASPPTEHRRGHEMGTEHGFHRAFDDAEKWAKQFDDPARDAWQKPDEVLDALKLTRSTRVADIGAGTGYFSVRIARRVSEGKVLAADVAPDMVRYLRERAQREQLQVLVPVQASADSPNLPEPVDLILVVDTYHHIHRRTPYFAKLKEMLRPNGRLAIVDFNMASPSGPPREHRIAPERVMAELAAAGYRLVETHTFLPRQYFLVFQAAP